MDYKEMIEKINDIRRHKGYLTNTFLTMPQLKHLFEKAGIQILEEEGLILLIEEQIDLIRVYFYATDDIAIQKIKYLLSHFNKPVIVDIVGKDPKAKDLADILIHNGFEQYSIFIRMTCDNPKRLNLGENSIVEYAKMDDINSIIKLLYSEFDPLFSHIPSSQDIISAIQREEITVIRKEHDLVGFAFFEVISSRNICLRYFIVDENYRNQGMGNKLLAQAFSYHGEGIKYMLWVGTYNSALDKYKSINFKPDGMIDYILKLKGE